MLDLRSQATILSFEHLLLATSMPVPLQDSSLPTLRERWVHLECLPLMVMDDLPGQLLP